MVYSTSRCPSCGQVIRRQTNPVKEIGIPFERCRHCCTTYRNSYKEEWITKSPIRRFFFFLQVYVWARAIMLPMLILIIPIAAFDWDTDIVFATWPFLSLAWLIGGYFVHRKAEQEDIAASLERTKDPQYVNLLRQAGYSIYPVADAYPNANAPTQANTQQPEPFITKNDICFCRKCGQKLVAGSLYCNKCGEKVMIDTNK